MAELKTKKNELSVDDFLDKVADPKTRKDCDAIVKLMKKVTGEKPKMWGTSIVGFGQYHYKYESGHEGDMCITGFSPRKGNIALYVLLGADGQAELLKKLGKHKAGKGCLYLKNLDDTDMGVLEKIVTNCVKAIKKKYPGK